MALQLYEIPLSPYARKAKIVLYEKNVPFERVLILPITITAADPAFATFEGSSPRLEVPFLIDGDFRCADSTIIVDYIDEKWPDPPMLPKAPEERARARMVEEICDTTLDAIVWGMMEVLFFRRAEGPDAEQMMTRAGLQLARVWDRLEVELEGRSWFSGERFGRADASLIVHVTGAASFGFPISTRHAKLCDWSVRSSQLESVKRDQADVVAFIQSEAGRTMRKGRQKRQYRDHRLEWMFRTGGREIVLRGLEEGSIHFVPWP